MTVERPDGGQVVDVAALLKDYQRRLPEIARAIIQRHQDPHDPTTAAFLADPNDVAQHKPEWHEWGIISHTAMVLAHLDHELWEHLRAWGMAEIVAEQLAQPIDGIPRRELLRFAALFHDLGKFSMRRSQKIGGFRFGGHEEDSERLVRELDLAARGLTAAQIDYIARTAGLHYELAKIRDAAVDRAEGFTSDFLGTDAFRRAARRLADSHPGLALEIGLLYLADTLGKTSSRAPSDPRASQLLVSLEMTRLYLKEIGEAS